MAAAPARTDGALAQLAACSRFPLFRKLLAVRLISQCGDGMFQIGLAALFFSPQNATTASGVALAFAVLLLPFTVVGPFSGPLLDRWRRQRILVWANTLRMFLTLVLAALMIAAPTHWAVYVLALVTLGVNRFLLAGLSAGLPHTLPRRLLLMANSITPSLGAVSVAVGAGLGFAINRLTPEGPIRNASTLVVAAALFTAASIAATRIGADELGPDEPPRTTLAVALARVIHAMADGARYLARRGTAGYSLLVVFAHRFLYGTNFLALILISRNLLADPSNADQGLAVFATLTTVSLIGNGTAIVVTPTIHRWMKAARWVVVCLGVSLVSQLILITGVRLIPVGIAAYLMGFGVQGAKIAIDTIVQEDTSDTYRGRAFTFYDMLYNAGFVGAAALAAVALPDTGWHPGVFALMSGAYVVVGVSYWAAMRRIGFTAREFPV